MRTLVCEMCGSGDFLKQDGVFVCQHCGIKYTTDEVKKMMIEGVVEVSGTVTTRKDLSGVKRIAEEAFERGDYKLAYEEYCKIAEQNPDDYESYFKRTIAYANQPFTIQDYDAISMPYQALGDYILNVENDPALSDEERAESINQAIVQITNVMFDFIQLSYQVNLDLDTIDEDSHHMHLNILEYYCDAYKELITKLITYSNKYPSESETMSKNALTNCTNMLEFINDLFKTKENSITENRYFLSAYGAEWWKDTAQFFIEHAHKIDSSYEPPAKLVPHKQHHEDEAPTRNNGCYIATCVYGSYDCPEVWTLRRFRDNTLAATWYGKLLIKTYYLISPTLVKWFGKTNWFKNNWKRFLDSMVTDLHSKGVESTPYQDKNW